MAVDTVRAMGAAPGWIERLARLEDVAQREALLAARPAADADTVRALADASRERLRVDLAQAERLAEAAELVARRLAEAAADSSPERSADGSPVTSRQRRLLDARARSRKALGHVRYLTGRYREALGLYGEALALYERAGDAPAAADVLSDSIQSLIYLGRYDEATAAVDRAQAILERHGDSLRLARLGCNRANLLHRQDRFAAALAAYEQALAEFRRHRGEPQDVAAALMGVLICAISLNDFPRATEAHAELLGHATAHDMPLVALQADYNVGYLHYLRGEYSRAMELYERTRERSRAAGDDYHQALCDMDECEIHLELNLTEEGDRLARRALAAFERLGMGHERAKSLAFLAIAAAQDGKPFEALEIFARARRGFEKEDNWAWPAAIDLYRALILNEQGRFFEARSLVEEALDFFRTAGLEVKAALSELLLARLELQTGRPAAARRECQAALGRLAALDMPALSYKAHFVLGQIEEAAGERSTAARAYRRAHEELESLRSHLHGETLRIAFLRDKQEVYERLVMSTLAGRPTAADHAAALDLIEQAKSRSLAELLAFRAAELPPPTPTHSRLVVRMRRLRANLSWYYRQIDRQELEGGPASRSTAPPAASPAAEAAATGRLDELRRRSRESERLLLRTLGEVQAGDAEFVSLQAALSLDSRRIRAALPDGCQLVEYFEALGEIYVALADRRRVEVFPLTAADGVRDLLRYFRFQLSKFRLDPDYLEAFGPRLLEGARRHLGELYAELVAPFRRLLEAEHLIFVPHGALHYLPFHALWDGDAYLCDRFSVSYAPSASVFVMCRDKPASAGGEALVLGVPDELTPAIRQEAEAVAAALPGSRLLIGERATLASLRDLGRNSRFVHVATHGFFRRDNAMFSAIQLGDSRLTLFDLYHLELGAELVALSGCGTGLGVVEGGDELIGLTRGLLYAGARSVLATLWDVNDRSTAEFMTAFYRRLASAPHRGAALRDAMLELRERHPHPYYWAPFVLTGDPFPAAPKKSG